MITVWSERGEDPGVVGLHDCTYAAGLMVLDAAGHTSWPLGHHTAAERNALERHDRRPDNTGALLTDLDTAVAGRYGVQLHTLAVGSTDQLAAQLAQPGRAYVLAGQLSHYPAGHVLRRWDPLYSGGHAVTGVTLPGALVQWLDPLAPMGYPGDTIPAALAARFAWTDWQARYLARAELARIPDTSTGAPAMDTTATITNHPAGTRIRFPAGGSFPLYAVDHVGGPVRTFTTPEHRGSTADCDATVVITRSPKAAPNGTFRRIAGGGYAGLLVLADQVQLIAPELPDLADFKARARAAIDAL